MSHYVITTCCAFHFYNLVLRLDIIQKMIYAFLIFYFRFRCLGWTTKSSWWYNRKRCDWRKGKRNRNEFNRENRVHRESRIEYVSFTTNRIGSVTWKAQNTLVLEQWYSGDESRWCSPNHKPARSCIWSKRSYAVHWW